MEAKPRDLLVAEAARWYARMRAPDCSTAERKACTEWRELSPAHEQAYSQAERVAARVSEALPSHPRLRAMAESALPTRTAARKELGMRWRMAAGLTTLGVALGLLAAAQWRKHDADITAHYQNTSNRQQEIMLPDGTKVHLDVGSSMAAQVSANVRHVELLSGRAYFDVTHDSSRPFSVDAGNVRTLDLGTRFQVTLASAAVSVTLAEGSVAVSKRAGADAWEETLVPGEQLTFSIASGTAERRNVDATALTSWSHGRLVFKDTPLAEAIEEVNRYASTKIRIGDNSLAAVPIGGDFIAGGDSEHVVDALAAILPLRVVHDGTYEIILFRRYESAGT